MTVSQESQSVKFVQSKSAYSTVALKLDIGTLEHTFIKLTSSCALLLCHVCTLLVC